MNEGLQNIHCKIPGLTQLFKQTLMFRNKDTEKQEGNPLKRFLSCYKRLNTKEFS